MGPSARDPTGSFSARLANWVGFQHGSLNVPIEHHPTIRYMVYNGYYKVMSNIPKMGHLPTPVTGWVFPGGATLSGLRRVKRRRFRDEKVTDFAIQQDESRKWNEVKTIFPPYFTSKKPCVFGETWGFYHGPIMGCSNRWRRHVPNGNDVSKLSGGEPDVTCCLNLRVRLDVNPRKETGRGSPMVWSVASSI